MALTPIEVQQKTFKVALRGYAEEEVDAFLDEVVISLREYEQQLREAEEHSSVLDEQLSAARDNQDVMQRTFLAAQKAADGIVEGARVEADGLIASARVEAARVDDENVRRHQELVSDLERIRGVVADLRSRLHAVASAAEGDFSDLDEETELALEETPGFGEESEPGVGAHELHLGEARLDEQEQEDQEETPGPDEDVASSEEGEDEDVASSEEGEDEDVASSEEDEDGSDAEERGVEAEVRRRPWERGG